MITVAEATQIILDCAKDFGTHTRALEQSIGHVLAEDLNADRDFPPFTRVTMDGIAIHYHAYAEGQRAFPVEGIQAAGEAQKSLSNLSACLEVMTGAMLPINTDTVIRYEDVEIREHTAHISPEAIVRPTQNAHPQGQDRQQGAVLIKAGRQISPAEVGVAATIGRPEVLVKKLPRVAIISTGDELVPISSTPAPHQIRSSNVPSISATLSRWGINPQAYHIVDELEATTEQLGHLLQEYDVLILSGGVSKGKFDYVPAALEALGVKKHFHRIKQRPGKPFWFGEAANGAVVFALPGNPVSSFMCNLRYFQPWLRKSLGLTPQVATFARLADTFSFKPSLTYFLQVKTAYDPQTAQLMATPVPGRGSGDLANLADADAFLELPAGQEQFEQGEIYPLHFYR
jgi:molybdopterin molybdotransferase